MDSKGNEAMNVTTKLSDLEQLRVLFDNPPTSLVAVYIFCIIIVFILIILVSFINIVVLLTIVKNTHLHSNSNCLVAFLSFIDLLSTIIVLPMYIMYAISCLLGKVWYTIYVICKVINCITVMFSIMTLNLIAIERTIAVFKPLRYTHFVTKTRLAIISGVQCSLWTTYIIIEFSLGNFATSEFSSLQLIINVTMIVYILSSTVLYLRIFALSRHHSRQIAAQEVHVSSRMRKETRSAMTMGLILGALYACFTPFAVVMVVHSVRTFTVLEYAMWYPLSLLFVFSNGGMNSIIYCLRNKEMKGRVLKLLGINSTIEISERDRSFISNSVKRKDNISVISIENANAK